MTCIKGVEDIQDEFERILVFKYSQFILFTKSIHLQFTYLGNWLIHFGDKNLRISILGILRCLIMSVSFFSVSLKFWIQSKFIYIFDLIRRKEILLIAIF